MIDVLGVAGREALTAFARRGTLIALDFDGTLAPIVARPQDAALPDGTRDRLMRVARRFPVIVLTGRSRSDALQRLGGAPVLEVIGSHGLETPGAAISRFVARVARWRATLAERVRSLVGVSIEDKRYSLAVHYRQAVDPESARHEISQIAAALDGARILGGKKVVNLLPQEAPGKGQALLAACARTGYARAIYVGDDETDEDIFALRRPQQIFGIRVGDDEASAAGYCLRSQAQIDDLLDALLAIKK